ncbi:putative pyridoxal phosphate-dependent aminotransferase EpsN [Peptococcaceae bacterium CEB3]|nr:putative pyridoxal phosphate-dependent aminotransferase EpsN [Peptococcaceae bacterium CEB3]
MNDKSIGLDLNDVVAALKQVLPTDQEAVPLHEPLFGGREWEYVKDCLDTGWVSSAGPYVSRFEEDLARFTGLKRAVAVVNGTAALHTALLLAGVKAEDEVLVPTLTFVATVNAVRYCQAVPRFVDADERTLGVDPVKLRRELAEIARFTPEGTVNSRTGRRIKALIVMHTFGHPADLDPLRDLCAEFDLDLIEDAAESLGSYYQGVHTGHWGKLAVLSFNGNKTITTGGGGAILTDDEDLANRAKHLTATAKQPHPWAYRHDEVGYNYRLPNLNAALGCAQLERLPELLAMKRALAGRYAKIFSGWPGLAFVSEPEFARSNYWLNALLLDENSGSQRDLLLELTHQAGILTRPAWDLMHTLPMFEPFPHGDLSTAEDLARRLVNIPSSPVLGQAISGRV